MDGLNKFGHLATLPTGPFRFIALDVETAGKTIGGICQIGLCFVSDTARLQTYSVLVDPEEPFEPFNTDLHGIGADIVAGAGTFPTVYAELFDLLNTHSLVQHSTFDQQRHSGPSGMARVERGRGARPCDPQKAPRT